MNVDSHYHYHTVTPSHYHYHTITLTPSLKLTHHTTAITLSHHHITTITPSHSLSHCHTITLPGHSILPQHTLLHHDPLMTHLMLSLQLISSACKLSHINLPDDFGAHYSYQERIRTVTTVRACNYIKIETGRNFPPVLKIVTHTAQAA